MTDLRQELKEILSEFFEQRDTEGTIARDAHAQHHIWLQSRIERDRRRTAFWQAFAAKSVPSAFWMALVAGGGWLAQEWARLLADHWK